MTYASILTIKGTATIPSDIRRELGLEPGMQVTFRKDSHTGKYVVERALTLEEIRAMNRASLKRSHTKDVPYESGDGFTVHVKETHHSR